MRARRRRVIATSILLALIGAALPIAAMAWMSWQIAVQKELNILDTFAARAFERAQGTFEDARNALETMEAKRLAPCSREHIALMRSVTIDTPSVEEIGYLEGGLLKCTSWGLAEGRIPKAKTDYVTGDGLEVSLRMQPGASAASRMTALQLGHHNALVVPSRFVDVPLDEAMSLAVLVDKGKILNTLNDPDMWYVAELSARTQRGLDGAKLYSVVSENGLTVYVLQPSAEVTAAYIRELLFLLPIGAFIAAFIVGIIVWMSRKRLSPVAELEIAIRKREFIVHYQPIVALKTGVCIGAEALVRWRRPDGRLVRPDHFIPFAEETGLIRPITDQVIESVIADLKTTLIEDRSLHIAVNLCADDVRTLRVLDFLEQKLPATGIRNEQIWLETTERGFIDIEAARDMLGKARKAGHSVAIDDFGTGYSSLQYLQGLPMDALKIDKSFVDTIGHDSATSTVILHIISMSRELGLFSVAEGVETEEQVAYLREHGVDYGQGWLFSKHLLRPNSSHISRRTGRNTAPHQNSSKRPSNE